MLLTADGVDGLGDGAAAMELHLFLIASHFFYIPSGRAGTTRGTYE